MEVENHKIQYVKKTIELKSKVEDCRIRLSQINRTTIPEPEHYVKLLAKSIGPGPFGTAPLRSSISMLGYSYPAYHL